MPARKKTPSTPDFEKSLQELEQLVAQLEKGELTLEDSLRQFERGVELTRTCQKALSEAQQKIEILSARDNMSRDDKADLKPFTQKQNPNAQD